MDSNFQLSSAQIETLLKAGSAAPSPANLQAWEVKVRSSRIELRLDLKRATSFLDVGKYAALLSLGAFAENVALTAHSMGLKHDLQILPELESGAVIVCFTFNGKSENPIPKDSDLQQFIFSRCTNRKFDEGVRLPEETVEKLRRELQASHLSIEFSAVSVREKKRVFEEVLGKGDAIRFFNPITRNEMFNEVCWSKEEASATHDRVALATLELPQPVIFMMRLMRQFPLLLKLIPQAKMEKVFLPQLEATSHLCCVSMKEPLEAIALFEVGRAIQRLWLRATQLGLSIQPWTVLPFLILRNELLNGKGFSLQEKAALVQTKGQLKEACDLPPHAVPLFIFRLFRGAPPSARSLRRSWKDFTEIES